MLACYVTLAALLGVEFHRCEIDRLILLKRRPLPFPTPVSVNAARHECHNRSCLEAKSRPRSLLMTRTHACRYGNDLRSGTAAVATALICYFIAAYAWCAAQPLCNSDQPSAGRATVSVL